MWTAALLALAPQIAGPSGPLVPLDLSSAQGTFTDAAWGDFDGDGQEDYVVRSGSTLNVFFAVGIHEALVTDFTNSAGGPPIRDFVILRRGPESTDPEGVDRIVFMAGSNLIEAQVDTSSGSLVVTTPSHPGFEDAVLLEAWSRPDGEKHWIVGVDATGANLSRARMISGSLFLDPDVPSGAAIPANAIALFDPDPDELDGTDEPELGFAANGSLTVLDPWGQDPAIYFIDPSFTYTALTPIRTGSHPESLGVLGDLSGLPFLVTWSGTHSNFQFLPVVEQFYTLSSGCMNSDDDRDDLVLSGRGGEVLFVLEDGADEQDSTPSFSYGQAMSFAYDAPPGSAASQQGQSVIMDLDHDGDGDLVVAVEAERSLRLLHYVEEEDGAADLKPELVKDAFETEDGDWSASLNPTAEEITFLLRKPAQVDAAYLDLVGWAANEPDEDLSQDRLFQERIELSQVGTEFLVTLNLKDAFGAAEWDHRVFVRLQQVDALGGDPINDPTTHCYPALGLYLIPKVLDVPNNQPKHAGLFSFLVGLNATLPPLPPGEEPEGGAQGGSGGDVNCFPPSGWPW